MALFLIILVIVNLSSAQESCDSTSTLEKLKELISKHYLWRNKVNQINANTVEEVIKQLRSIGDPWTIITKESEDRLWYNQSKLVGLGIRWNDEGVITKVFENSPAHKAGLKKYDKILSIQSIRNSDRWVETIRNAKPEEPIELVILRGDKLLRFYLQKGEFQIPPVDETYIFEVKGKRYGYLQLNNFTNPAVELFIQEVKKLAKENIDALIIDLRYNGGGLISVVKRIAEIFINEQTPLFYLDNLQGNVTFYVTNNNEVLYNGEIIFLTSKATASASEILIALLRYYKNAKVIGSLSTGKYVGSNMYKLNDCGEVLRLVSFEIKLFDGYPVVSELGILPDCFVRNPTNFFPEELILMCEHSETGAEKIAVKRSLKSP